MQHCGDAGCWRECNRQKKYIRVCQLHFEKRFLRPQYGNENVSNQKRLFNDEAVPTLELHKRQRLSSAERDGLAHNVIDENNTSSTDRGTRLSLS